MSRATDAFSSLISDVPGVDTSCFVKRSLNDLRTTPSSKTASPPTAPIVDETPVRTPPPDPSFASLDLDALAKPSTPKMAAQSAAPLEDLFDHVQGCEDAILVPEQSYAVPIPEPEPTSESVSAEGESGDFELKGLGREEEYLDEEVAPSAPPLQPEPPVWTFEDTPTKPSDLKHKLGKYKATWNKKAVDLKKRMKQGLGAAHEWVDKYVEERKHSSQISSQKREETKQIEQFLAELEQLSHYRREVLMGELPAEFFQKVMDYAHRKHISVEHLFVTSEETAHLHETQQVFPEEEIQGSHIDMTGDEGQGSYGDVTGKSGYVDVTGNLGQGGYINVTGDLGQGGYINVTGEEVVGAYVDVTGKGSDVDVTSNEEQRVYVSVTGEPAQQQEAVEEDFDLLGLSDNPAPPAPEVAVPVTSHDDLDDLFGCASIHRAPEASSSPAPVVLPDQDDLMAFEGGCRSQVKSDFSTMYRQLKAGGRHSEEEIRAILKEKRLQEQQQKMAAALQAKVEREREVEQTQELLHNLKEQHLHKIAAWKEKHANNMRGLLTSLETVLWENSGWKPLTVGDVLEPSQVKRAYMKANLIIHPDKVKQKGGMAEQVVLADMVFNVLKEGWQKFQT